MPGCGIDRYASIDKLDLHGQFGYIAVDSFDKVFQNCLMRRQMLFYGVVSLYNDGLEKFMNM